MDKNLTLNDKTEYEIYHKDKYDDFAAYQERPRIRLRDWGGRSIIQCYYNDEGDVNTWTVNDHNYAVDQLNKHNFKSEKQYSKWTEVNKMQRCVKQMYDKIFAYWIDLEECKPLKCYYCHEILEREYFKYRYVLWSEDAYCDICKRCNSSRRKSGQMHACDEVLPAKQ